MTDNGQQRFAERMFPEPVDPGIAQPDRAASSVVHGTDTGPKGEWRNDIWYQGSGRIGEKAVERIQIYPPTQGLQTQGDPWEPVRVGVLVDMEIGQLLADWIDPTMLAIEDAMNEGVYQRGPIELVTVDARGLPRENYLKARKGYLKLVEEGCVVVLGPMISDNSVNIRDLVNQTGVACIGWTGSTRFDGEYCFTVANGDIPTESVMGAHWCKGNGYEKVGFFWELGSSGTDYRDWFLSEARNLGLEVVDTVPLSPNPVGMDDSLAKMRDRGAQAIVYMGYGYSTFHFKRAFDALEWDPPRFMGTAFMFYSNTNEWAQGLEGWHGVDQLGEDGTNPNYEALMERFERRFGRTSRNVVVALAYDTARAAIHGIANATIAIPKEVKLGLEKIKWMPCTNGGPGTYITFAPHDHRGYKGDFLTIRHLRGGKCDFVGYHRPQWPSNKSSPLLIS
jgi:ABC-type branched-subunit amino acid transport system substrate-binding protein